ncbi:MAG: hypothetical protein HOP17_16495 [Acidobacteria bacterium]|nr:hypothetical protein [Acidobacteriota bacterium]
MRKSVQFLSSFVFIISVAVFAFGQAPTGVVKNTILSGDVVSVDAARIVLKTKDGAVAVTLSDKTEYKRVPPENPVLKAAVAATLSDIGEGDKLLVSGMISEDKKTLPAKSVYLMTKADIAQRPAKDLERWNTRGVSGKIKTLNADTKQITIEVSGLMGSRTVTLTPKSNATFKRYAPNSVKYSEAVAGSFGEIGVGDVLRAVGDKSADGASFAAEEILTGGFQTNAGTIKSVDVAKNEVVMTEMQSKKDVTVSLGQASLLKKFPEQMAQILAMRQAGGGMAGPGGQAGQGGQMMRTGGQGAQGTPGAAGPGGPGGGPRGGSIDEMLERFPNITAADLKVGDIIAVSSSKTGALDRITAIKLLAGVEPFLRAAQASSGGQRQGSQSLNIPGLDGFDMN